MLFDCFFNNLARSLVSTVFLDASTVLADAGIEAGFFSLLLILVVPSFCDRDMLCIRRTHPTMCYRLKQHEEVFNA